MNASRPVPLPARLSAGPFRTSTALELGLTPKALTGRRFVRLFRDVYVVRERADDPLVRAAGALLVAPHGVVGHVTAARAWGLPTPTAAPEPGETVHLLVATGSRVPRRAGLTLHEVPMPAADVAERHGLPVAVPARILVDVGATWCLGDLVALGDAAIARGLLDLDELADRIRAASGHRGVAAVRVAAGMMDGSSPSAAASRLRVLLTVAGVPRPTHAAADTLTWPDLDVYVAVDPRGIEVLPQLQVRRAWEALLDAGWRPARPRPALHEALAAIGAFRAASSWDEGRPA